MNWLELAPVKQFLSVDHSLDDQVIESLIAASLDIIENYLEQSILYQEKTIEVATSVFTINDFQPWQIRKITDKKEESDKQWQQRNKQILILDQLAKPPFTVDYVVGSSVIEPTYKLAGLEFIRESYGLSPPYKKNCNWRSMLFPFKKFII